MATVGVEGLGGVQGGKGCAGVVERSGVWDLGYDFVRPGWEEEVIDFETEFGGKVEESEYILFLISSVISFFCFDFAGR